MSHAYSDATVEALQAELRATLDRMQDALERTGDRLALSPITFRADHQLEADIAGFMRCSGIVNQSAAIRTLIYRGLRANGTI